MRFLRGLSLVLASLLLAAFGAGCLLSTGAPSLIEPSAGDTLKGSQAVFLWGNVEGAAYYRLEIASDSFFGGPAVSGDSIVGTSYTLDLSIETSPLEGERTYYWHVGAHKEGWGPWSETRSFYNANLKRP